MMAEMRQAIAEDRFVEWRQGFYALMKLSIEFAYEAA